MARPGQLTTAKYHQELGERHYREAVVMEDQNAPQQKIDASWKLAALDFWSALALGSEKSPLSLFKCFVQGVGVQKNEDIARLMYGAALKLTPKDAAEILEGSRPVIPKEMQPRVEEVVKLVKDTQASLPKEGVNAAVWNSQLTKFNNSIKLPYGQKIHDFLTDKVQNNSKQITAQEQATALKKSLQNQNKILPNTNIPNNKPSAKGEGFSR